MVKNNNNNNKNPSVEHSPTRIERRQWMGRWHSTLRTSRGKLSLRYLFYYLYPTVVLLRAEMMSHLPSNSLFFAHSRCSWMSHEGISSSLGEEACSNDTQCGVTYGKGCRLWREMTWGRIPVLPNVSCPLSGKFLPLPLPLLPHE